jgi:hypothetical protein
MLLVCLVLLRPYNDLGSITGAEVVYYYHYCNPLIHWICPCCGQAALHGDLMVPSAILALPRRLNRSNVGEIHAGAEDLRVEFARMLGP